MPELLARFRRGGVPVARKNLLDDPVRLAVSVGGVTFAVLLILVVGSLYRGYQRQLGAFVDDVPADIWVAEANTNGLIYSSLVPDSAVASVGAIPGVARVVPLYGQRVTVDFNGGTADTFVMAFDLPAEAGRALGLAIPAPGEIVIDRAFARKHGLRVGDTLTTHERTFRIGAEASIASVGLSRLSIMSAEDARALLTIPGYTSYLLVMVTSGADAASVVRKIEAGVPGVHAMTRADFAAANRTEVSGTFLPIVRVLVVVAFLVGAAVVGITIYTATVERVEEYGLLKAIGASAGQIFRIVLAQSVIVGVAGFALGVPLTLASNWLAARYVPDFITLVLPRDVAAVFAAAIGMALLAAVIPVRRIAGIDPARVFRA